MHDEFQAHFAANCRLTKNGTNVQKTNAAHLKQVLQQLWAARFNGGLVDAKQVNGIIGHQAIAPRNQLQAQLAFAQARLSRDQDTQAQNIHEDTMHGGAIGKVFGQIGPEHINHKRRRLRRCEHRDLGALTHAKQCVWRNLPIGQDQHRRL